ncbi:MAG: carbonic anhydrase [Planctomycetota bacterium]
MRLLDTILERNRTGGTAPLPAGAGPLVILSCIDPRLNDTLPRALGLDGEAFVWLRNAGNIVTGPMSSTLRSLALACAVKGGKEIAVVGHTECRVAKTSVMALMDRFGTLGIPRTKLPDDLVTFFGLFTSERQNVITAAKTIRQSPLIGTKIPVHGLLLDITSNRIEWLVNGYDAASATAVSVAATAPPGPPPLPRTDAETAPIEMKPEEVFRVVMKEKFKNSEQGLSPKEYLHRVEKSGYNAGKIPDKGARNPKGNKTPNGIGAAPGQ